MEFFRRYQRYIYFVVTFFVIVSFSFFGTFNVLPSLRSSTITAFTAINGRSIKQTDVEELTMFISSDSIDKLLYGGMWGPNFLNDGVVRKDILETGIATVLMDHFTPALGDELQSRLAKEKRYRPYQHPEAPFLGATGVWSYFAPGINQSLGELQGQATATSPEALRARIDLYLAQSSFPAPLLHQVLFYQQKQYGWLSEDPDLQQTDFSLFGYHSLQEWFGTRFMHLVSEFIINSAIQAEKMGYEVSRSEVLADLVRNATLSYQQNQHNQRTGVINSDEYFKQQLQRMGLDQNKAIALWRQVMLFRRLYNDQGAVALVGRLPFEQFESYAREGVKGELYTLPETLHLGDFKALQRLQVYLEAVAAPNTDLLALPKEFLEIEKVAATFPDLVHKRYVLEIAEVDKADLEGKVSMKEMWEWQFSDEHWKKLQEKFPALAIEKGDSAELRQAALNTLDSSARQKINQLARAAIVEEHPEWLDEALQSATVSRLEVGLPLQGMSVQLKGISDTKELLTLLDTAPVQSEIAEKKQVVMPQLQHYSGDGRIHYRIVVLERKGPEILTFGAASASGALDRAIEADLKAYYEKTRLAAPTGYLNTDGTWKAFELVRETVAKNRYAQLLTAIRAEAESEKVLAADALPLNGDSAAALRFLRHVRATQKSVQAGEKAGFVRSAQQESISTLQEQWQLLSQAFEESRANKVAAVDREQAFGMRSGDWSVIATPPNGALSFFKVESKGSSDTEEAIREHANSAHQLLAQEAKHQLAEAFITVMADQGAISLSFMDKANGTEVITEMPVEHKE